MNKKIIIWTVAAALLLVGGFFLLNDYIYNEKQGEQVPAATPENSSGEVTETKTEPEPIVVKDFEGEADPKRMTLGMNNWTWISVTYSDGTIIKPKQERAFTLDLKNDGTFSATTDCNQIGGKYTAKDGAIKFSNMMSTLMFCEGSQEVDFQKVLERSAGYFFTSKGELILDIEHDSGSAVFR